MEGDQAARRGYPARKNPVFPIFHQIVSRYLEAFTHGVRVVIPGPDLTRGRIQKPGPPLDGACAIASNSTTCESRLPSPSPYVGPLDRFLKGRFLRTSRPCGLAKEGRTGL